RVVLRTARLEQLRHPRQTAGDVARLGALHRDTRDRVAGPDFRVRLDRQDRLDGEQVAGIAAARRLLDLAVLALDHDRRLEVARPRIGAPIRDHALGDAGRLVRRLLDGDSVDQVLVGDVAVDLGQHRAGIGVPFRQPLAALHLLAVVDKETGAVGDAVDRALGAVPVEDDDLHVAGHRDHAAFRVLGDVVVADLDRAVEARIERRLVDDLRRAADVEGAHGELRARLADRLRRDDADRLADIDRRAAGEVASIALGADAALGLAGQHRADADRLDVGLLDLLE